MFNFFNIYQRIKKHFLVKEDLKTRVNPKLVKKITADPDFPFLVSFGRTGSHWLRMMMELYTGKPSMRRIFYYTDAKEFTCCHTHDSDLKTTRKNVIYLYRNPVGTVFSKINYFKQDLDSEKVIIETLNRYIKHLTKWLLEENFTTKKTIISYDGMKNDINNEFKKICDHLSYEFDAEKLKNVTKQISKEKLKEMTNYNPQIVHIESEYELKRKKFYKNYKDFIYRHLFKKDDKFKNFFNYND